MEDFYKTLRPIRTLRGMKQQELAFLLNVRQQSISKMEIGLIKISSQTAKKIAVHFGFETKEDMLNFYMSLFNTPLENKKEHE
ncbi:hypothetical protein DYBT9275_00724 [Dyadobacter sp. CECT 9275]|uniref:HTH cro/C1-type domain-containing protein n=1 Tax=Dyadobacter helix TaxID=2822344 RepID=A0A916N2S0_9BACT|nr:helix-turn-helix transcriptional regulator [Dyadobacter sp. CECT 9275]CAG4991311.1 hypothetical protein DYBT9275_00724 [Dyadobacter sp. CECT 9275]